MLLCISADNQRRFIRAIQTENVAVFFLGTLRDALEHPKLQPYPSDVV